MATLKNLFMFAAILVYVLGVCGAPIDNYDSQINMNQIIKRGIPACDGFTMSKPSFDPSLGTNKVKENSDVNTEWVKGPSDVATVVSLEMLQEGTGYLGALWNGNLSFSNGVASQVVKFTPPLRMDKSKPVILRSWANTNSGPHCTAYSKPFTFYQ